MVKALDCDIDPDIRNMLAAVRNAPFYVVILRRNNFFLFVIIIVLSSAIDAEVTQRKDFDKMNIGDLADMCSRRVAHTMF